MAKKKSKKQKKKSKSELKIHYKIVYQNRKLAKLKKEIELLNDIPSAYKTPKTRLKLEATREIDRYIKKGQKRKFKTIQNGLLNEGVKIQNVLYGLKAKMSRFKKPSLKDFDDKSKRGEKRRVVGRAWQSNDFDNVIYKGNLKTVNGIDIKKDKDEVDALLNSYKLKMNSNTMLVLHIDRSGNARIALTSTEANEEIED